MSRFARLRSLRAKRHRHLRQSGREFADQRPGWTAGGIHEEAAAIHVREIAHRCMTTEENSEEIVESWQMSAAFERAYVQTAIGGISLRADVERRRVPRHVKDEQPGGAATPVRARLGRKRQSRKRIVTQRGQNRPRIGEAGDVAFTQRTHPVDDVCIKAAAKHDKKQPTARRTRVDGRRLTTLDRPTCLIDVARQSHVFG